MSQESDSPQPASSQASGRTAKIMKAFKVSLARMDADPAEAARIRALADRTDAQALPDQLEANADNTAVATRNAEIARALSSGQAGLTATLTATRATLTQSLAPKGASLSRHFQLIVYVYVLLLSNQTEVLLGQRADTGYADGAYEPPSGRLAEHETLAEAATRIAAQIGIVLDPQQISLVHVLHDVTGAGRMAFFLTANDWAGEAVEATDSYSNFTWFPLGQLPDNMTGHSGQAMRNYAAGTRFSTYPSFGM